MASDTNGSGKPFIITGADGKRLEIPHGDYYFNTKARCRRLMQNSLSSDARRVHACLELATMGWTRELALANNGQPLTSADIAEQTGLVKQHVAHGLQELEEVGLALRKSDDDGPPRRGHVRIFSWAFPKPSDTQLADSNCAQLQSSLQFPDWFPESWESLKPLIKRLRVKLDTELVTARSSIIEEGAEIARAYEEAEKNVRALLERVRAQDDLYKEDRTYRTTDRTEERGGRKATSSIEVPEQPRSSPPSPPAVIPEPQPEPVTAVVVSKDPANERFEVFCFLMEGSGRPVSVDSVAECRRVFFRYPPETQQRIVDDATTRSQGKWRESEFTPAPLNYLNNRIWDKAPITKRKFAPVRPPTRKEESDAVMRAHIERARQRDRERNGSGV